MDLRKILFLAFGAVLLVAAGKVPSARDGGQYGAVSDGRQNYPVQLYGVARDWSKQCTRGKAEQCMRLGDAFAVGLGDLKQDGRAAIGYWLKACDLGAGEGCRKAAGTIEAGTTGYAPFPQLAFSTGNKGCALGNHASCAIAALHYYNGDTTAQDRARALQLWNAGCSAGDEDSCRLKAGALLYAGTGQADRQQAAALYRAGCDRGQGWGCSGLADAYAKGLGVARSDAEAAAAARKGCTKTQGDTQLACALHGRYLARTGRAEDMKLATRLLSKACLAGRAEACNEAGEIARRNPPGSGFAAWEVALNFRDGCDLNYAPACYNLGDLYLDKASKLKRDAARAYALWDKACRLGSKPGCDTIAAIEPDLKRQIRAKMPAVDPAAASWDQLEQARRLSKQGRGQDALLAVARLMEEGNAEAEWLLGNWLYFGYPGVLDVNKGQGFTLFENAARQGHVEALKFVSMAYWTGDGVSQDRDKALGYMRYAAGKGDEMALAIYRSMQAEPIRQAQARRAREMAELAERRRNDPWYQFSLAVSAAAAQRAYQPGRNTPRTSSYSSNSWKTAGDIIRESNWNQAINYAQGYTTACPQINPYC